EPDGSTPEISASDIDLVLVPGLAFDVGGGRLGYGGGYYDRLLASLPGSVPTVGVTLDELIVDAVPVEPHDVGVSHLVTQSGLRLASAQRRTAVRSKARS